MSIAMFTVFCLLVINVSGYNSNPPPPTHPHTQTIINTVWYESFHYVLKNGSTLCHFCGEHNRLFEP